MSVIDSKKLSMMSFRKVVSTFSASCSGDAADAHAGGDRRSRAGRPAPVPSPPSRGDRFGDPREPRPRLCRGAHPRRRAGARHGRPPRRDRHRRAHAARRTGPSRHRAALQGRGSPHRFRRADGRERRDRLRPARGREGPDRRPSRRRRRDPVRRGRRERARSPWIAPDDPFPRRRAGRGSWPAT